MSPSTSWTTALVRRARASSPRVAARTAGGQGHSPGRVISTRGQSCSTAATTGSNRRASREVLGQHGEIGAAALGLPPAKAHLHPLVPGSRRGGYHAVGVHDHRRFVGRNACGH